MAETPQPVVVVAHGPYEDLAIELIKFATSIVESQSPAVKAELWKMHLDDLRQWRAFWAAFRSGIGDAFKESAK